MTDQTNAVAKAEEWRPVLSFAGCEASSLGRVRVDGRIRAPYVRRDGYVTATVDGVPRYVHRLVCEAFHGTAPEGFAAAHIDGTRDGNRPENLTWASYAENEAHKVAHGTKAMGSRCGRAKLTEDLVVAIRAAWRMRFATQTQMGRLFGVSQTKISDVVNYRTWRHVE